MEAGLLGWPGSQSLFATGDLFALGDVEPISLRHGLYSTQCDSSTADMRDCRATENLPARVA